MWVSNALEYLIYTRLINYYHHYIFFIIHNLYHYHYCEKSRLIVSHNTLKNNFNKDLSTFTSPFSNDTSDKSFHIFHKNQTCLLYEQWQFSLLTSSVRSSVSWTILSGTIKLSTFCRLISLSSASTLWLISLLLRRAMMSHSANKNNAATKELMPVNINEKKYESVTSLIKPVV